MGGITGGRAERGFVLLDVIVGLAIVIIGFALVLGGMSVAGGTLAKQDARIRSWIEQRNAHAAERTVVFEAKQ